MEKIKAMIPIFFLFLVIAPDVGESVLPVILLTKLRSMTDLSSELYSKISDLTNYIEFLSPSNELQLEDILSEIKDVSNKIDQAFERIEQKMDVAVQTLIERIPLKQEVNTVTRYIVDHISRVDTLYEEFSDYSNGKKNYPGPLLEKFATSLTSTASDELYDTLKKIESQVLPGRTAHLADGYLILLSKQTQASKLEICDTGISPQRKLYEFYSTVMLTEIRGYVMTIFGFAILEGIHNSTFASSMQTSHEKFQSRSTKYFNNIIKAAKTAPRDIRTCDPPAHKRGETFDEFSGLVQAYIVPESDLSAIDSCTGSCANIKERGLNKVEYRNVDKNWQREQDCTGIIDECGYGGGDIKLCEMPKNSSRRYEWFKDNDGTMYGKDSGCKEGKEITTSGWKRGLVRCDYCLCVCTSTFRSSPAIRAISLKDQITKTGENMVVVGVRLIIKDKMLQIQIQEGKLAPQGEIVADSTKWIELENYLFTHHYSNLSRDGEFYRIEGSDEQIKNAKEHESIGGIQATNLIEDTDFAFLGERRNLNLDDIYVEPNYVITGARLQWFQKPKSDHDYPPIRLEVQATSFDFEKGELDQTSPHKWISAESMRKEEKPPQYNRQRMGINLKHVENPINSELNLPDSQPNQYVTFQNSDFKKDAGQSTVPFIDIMPLSTSPPLALGGIGIFHKGRKGYGGFISPRIMNLDMTMYMKKE